MAEIPGNGHRRELHPTPSDPALVAYYGGLGPDRSAATALASLLYDVENDIIVDAKIGPVSGNERDLAEEHLQALVRLEIYEPGRELVIFDRGYPSYEFVKSLQDKQIVYVMRTQKGFMREWERSGAKEGWVELGKTGVRVRAIRIELACGETETLITNIGEGRLEYEAFKELYHKRWGIVQNGEAEAGAGELFREAGGQHQAGFLRDDDGIEYAGQLRA